ncbi:hypothetical protein TorRG33x02_195310 [Trema orientale]|uniref:Uncharacterized protein n=1 Tax=Trema orientale TaxID=63057 RepID=A0A2P5EGT3_TREOI|nr:hypothetical protein TorRG33x02_195310 [Trema orientale]
MNQKWSHFKLLIAPLRDFGSTTILVFDPTLGKAIISRPAPVDSTQWWLNLIKTLGTHPCSSALLILEDRESVNTYAEHNSHLLAMWIFKNGGCLTNGWRQACPEIVYKQCIETNALLIYLILWMNRYPIKMFVSL